MYMNVIHAENSLLKSHDTELFSAHRSELIVQPTDLQIKTVHVNSFYFIADSKDCTINYAKRPVLTEKLLAM
jgi:hypothetical protein